MGGAPTAHEEAKQEVQLKEGEEKKQEDQPVQNEQEDKLKKQYEDFM